MEIITDKRKKVHANANVFLHSVYRYDVFRELKIETYAIIINIMYISWQFSSIHTILFLMLVEQLLGNKTKRN